MKKLIGVAAFALVAGFAGGYLCGNGRGGMAMERSSEPKAVKARPEADRPERAAKPAMAKPGRKAQDPAAPAKRANIRGQAVTKAPSAHAPKEGEMLINGKSFGDYLADLKQQDPQGYEAMTNGFARMWNARTATLDDKIAFLESVDSAKMAPEDRAAHEKLLEILTKNRQQEEGMGSLETSQANYGEVMLDRIQDQQALKDARTQERDALLRQTAAALGYEGDTARALVETVKRIYDVTGEGGADSPLVPPFVQALQSAAIQQATKAAGVKGGEGGAITTTVITRPDEGK